jgi:hypothetical protein
MTAMQRRVALLIGVWAAVSLIQVGWSQLPSPPQQIRGRTLTEWKQKLTSQDASEVYQALVALRSVNFMEVHEALVQNFEFLLNHPNTWVRIEAMNQLIRRNPPSYLLSASKMARHVPRLEQQLQEPDPMVRVAACRFLGWLSFKVPLRPVPAGLYAALSDQEPVVRCAALEALRLSGRKSEKVLNRFRQAVSDTDPTVRLAALRGLTCCYERLGQEDWKLVREVFGKDRGAPRVQAAILLLLAGQTDDQVLKFLCNVVTSRDNLWFDRSLTSLTNVDRVFNVMYEIMAPIFSYHRTEVASAAMLLPAIPEPLLQAFIETAVINKGYVSYEELLPLLRARTFDQAHLDTLRKALATEKDERRAALVLAILVRHLPEKEAVTEVQAALQRFPSMITFLTVSLFDEIRSRNLKEMEPLLRILLNHCGTDPHVGRVLVLLYYFTGDKKILEKLHEVWKTTSGFITPVETEMVLSKLGAERDPMYLDFVESALNGKLPRVPAGYVFSALAEKGMDVPDRLLPKMRVMFWTAQIENRIHLAEILYRKEGYMPARVMLETLASADDVPANWRQQASEALTRLKLASQTGQNPPPEQRKSLIERWQAMERVQFRTLQNYPLVKLGDALLTSPLWQFERTRVDLVDPLLEEIRKQDPELARKLEDMD